jgi:hypothetical protein
MTARDLDDVLREAGDQVPLAPPPVAEMLDQHRRHLRRRTWAASVAASVVVAAASGGMWFVADRGSPAVPFPDLVADVRPGHVWVGLSSVAIQVPEQWRGGVVGCGGPEEDAVEVVSPGRAVPACSSGWQDDRTLVTVYAMSELDSRTGGWADEGPAFTRSKIDGTDVRVREVSCLDVRPDRDASIEVCSGQVQVPDEHVEFTVQSTSGADVVEDLLATIRVLPGQAGVPDAFGFRAKYQESSGEEYVKALRELGLEPNVTYRAGDGQPGTLLSVEPAAGTMLGRGSTVEVVVIDEPDLKEQARAEAETTMQTVGLGHVSIEVPESWPSDAVECGAPEGNTYTVEGADDATRACAGMWRPDRTWVQFRDVGASVKALEPGWSVSEIDGTSVQVSRRACEATEQLDGSPLELCTSAVRFPVDGVEVTVHSTAGPDAVARRLDTLRVVPDKVGMPSYMTFRNDHQERSGEKYAQRLRELGIEPRISRRPHEGLPAGFVIETFPEPGRLADAGSTVDVVISSGKG